MKDVLLFPFNFIMYFFKGLYYIFSGKFLRVKDVESNKTIMDEIRDGRKNAALRKNLKKGSTSEQAMKIDYNGSEATKYNKKILWEYTAINSSGNLVKGYFEAYSKVEVHSFLLSEGMTVYDIRTSRWIRLLHSNLAGSKGVKMKNRDLIFFLTQLSTYIKAGIPLAESFNILTRQYKKKYAKMFRSMMYDLTMGDNFSTVLEKQGDSFPSILINMVKASELTGELPEALDDMV